jgi:glycosyltransferase involved in cell wall biosynthesis
MLTATTVSNDTSNDPLNKPLKVLLMISSMRGGGSEQQTLLLLKHIDRSRFEPHLYLLSTAGSLMDQVPNDVTVHVFEPPSKQNWLNLPGKILRQQISHLKSVLKTHEIDVIYDRTFHMSLIAGPAGFATRTPRVATIVSPPELALTLLEKRYRWLKRRRLAKAYQRAYQVIAVSQNVLDSARSYYKIPKNQLVKIANPVDRERLTNLAQQDQVQRDDRWTFACVARMTEEKGHRDLLRAIHLLEEAWPEDLPAIHLWLIGDGPLRDELERDAKGLDTHQITFLGSQHNPWRFIKTADAVIVPSHFEGMPNVVLEAMSLRTAVIATRIGGTSELEKDKSTIWWTNPKSPESIAHAMIDFATRPSEVQDRLDAAELLLTKNHSIQNQVQKIESVLQQACNVSSEKPS